MKRTFVFVVAGVGAQVQSLPLPSSEASSCQSSQGSLRRSESDPDRRVQTPAGHDAPGSWTQAGRQSLSHSSTQSSQVGKAELLYFCPSVNVCVLKMDVVVIFKCRLSLILIEILKIWIHLWLFNWSFSLETPFKASIISGSCLTFLPFYKMSLLHQFS